MAGGEDAASLFRLQYIMIRGPKRKIIWLWAGRKTLESRMREMLEGCKYVMMGMLPSHAGCRISCLYRTRGWRRGFLWWVPWSSMFSMRFRVPSSSVSHSLVHNALVGRIHLRCNVKWFLWFCRLGQQWRVCGCFRSRRGHGATLLAQRCRRGSNG